MKDNVGKVVVGIVAFLLGLVCGYFGVQMAYKRPVASPETQTAIPAPTEPSQDNSFIITIDPVVGGGITGVATVTQIKADGTVSTITTSPKKSPVTTKLGVTTFDNMTALLKGLSPSTLDALVATDKGPKPGCKEWDVTRSSKQYVIHFCTVPDELDAAQQTVDTIIADLRAT